MRGGGGERRRGRETETEKKREKEREREREIEREREKGMFGISAHFSRSFCFAYLYRGTSLIKNSPSPRDFHRALGMVQENASIEWLMVYMGT